MTDVKYFCSTAQTDHTATIPTSLMNCYVYVVCFLYLYFDWHITMHIVYSNCLYLLSFSFVYLQ